MPAKSTHPLHKMNLFTLMMVSSAFVVSVRNLPTMSETGLQMLFFMLIAAICFFFPAALVSAELATGWPEQGGVYVWVKEAFGKGFALVAVWLQWIYMLLTVISILYFIAGSFAFVFNPVLANSRVFLIIILLLITWIGTITSLRGQQTSSFISSVGFIGGVLIPGLLVAVLGVIYITMGNPIHLNLSLTPHNLLPDFGHIATLVLMVGFMKAFAGVEASASHANEVINPSRNYPLAILSVVIFGISINILGSLAIAVVIPQKDISLVAGIMEAFNVFFPKFHLGWLVPIMGLLVAGGAIGSVNTWLLGPVKGLLATAQDGDLPAFCRTVNKRGIPRNLVIIQGVILSVVGVLLMLMPNINIAFWVTVAVSMMCYFTMYLFIFLSVIYLRYKAPAVKRAYRIPLGNTGVWCVAGLGLITVLFALFIAFIPPAQLPSGNHVIYTSALLVSFLITILVPIILWKCRRFYH